MDKKWYWIELIGFDKNAVDFGIDDFLGKVKNAEGVSLLLYNIDFVNLHEGLNTEKLLSPCECSYAAHPFNEDRRIQSWTNYNLRDFVAALKAHGLKVLLSFFNNYMYGDDDGNAVFCEFGNNHPELNEFCSSEFYPVRALNILKRFKDGTYYHDFLIKQTLRVLTDYGFTGLHMSDGISTNRYCIQSGDFSDDMVDQYLCKTNNKLPSDIKNKCDNEKVAHIARYKYIIENQRYDYTIFLSECFSSYYKKFVQALNDNDKLLLFNNAWTRNPFEALFRYGIDYKKLGDSSVYGIMIEDVGGSYPVLSEADMGGFRVGVADRKNAPLKFMLTQQSIKCHAPHLNQYNMTPIKDTFENWNLVDCAPYELSKMILRRKNAAVYDGENFTKISNGAVYCLSDGLKSQTWQQIISYDEAAQLPDFGSPVGFTAIWSDIALNKELKRFIIERKYYSNKVFEDAMEAGISITTMANADDINKIKSPIFAANIEFYSPKQIDSLENFTSAPMFIASYNNVIKKQADYIIRCKDSNLTIAAYNTYAKGKNCIVKSKKSTKMSVSPYDAHGGIWTAKIKCDKQTAIFESMYKNTKQYYPTVENGADCRLVCIKCKNDKLLLFAYVESSFAEIVKIKFPFSVKSIRSLSKPDWYKISINNDCAIVRIANRAAEVFEIQLL